MSKMIASYNAYLERWRAEHPNVVQPRILEDACSTNLWRGESFTTVCRYWQDFGNVYLMPNGHVYEVVMRSTRPLIACFSSLEEWRAYDQPSTIRQYHDEW
jgi:hypothetical protein